MPQEIFDAEKFLELSQKASECRIKRLGEVVKLKIRTNTRLFTIKLPTSEANALLQKITCNKVEL